MADRFGRERSAKPKGTAKIIAKEVNCPDPFGGTCFHQNFGILPAFGRQDDALFGRQDDALFGRQDDGFIWPSG